MNEFILSAWNLDKKSCSVDLFGNGLINHSWKIVSGSEEFLLQKINKKVFGRPADIMENCSLLSEYLRTADPAYLFVAPIETVSGKNYILFEEEYYRLFPFVTNSFTINELSDPKMAFEAARQFGKFSSSLSGFDPARLHITLPDFHNLTLRFQQFNSALEKGNKERISETRESIRYLLNQKNIVDVFEQIKTNQSSRSRVIHHDSKINNVLFDRSSLKGVCVIDLDTVMPGYYISDVGDMLRTYLSPAGEEEAEVEKIEIREDYFYQILSGYMAEMKSHLSREETKYFIYSGRFAIYMQALRFLTDYINNDIYYNIQFEKQNLVRSENQIVLLKKYIEKESALSRIANTE